MTRISAPTPFVWVIGRTKTDGPADYDAVHEIQAGYKVTALSDRGKPAKPVEVKIDPTVDMKTPPEVQVDTMTAAKYFAYAAELLKVNPPHITDEPIIAQLKKIGKASVRTCLKMQYILSIWSTKPASRSTAPTSTRLVLRRAPRRR
jgi:hypothetical protein